MILSYLMKPGVVWPCVYPWLLERLLLADTRCIEFWRLKPDFRRILGSNVRKCAWKVPFHKPCNFGCVWRWIQPCEQNSVPKSGRARLYSVKVIKMSRQATDRLLILWSLHCCETDCITFLSWTRSTLREHNPNMPKTLPFLTAPISSRDGVWNFLSARKSCEYAELIYLKT